MTPPPSDRSLFWNMVVACFTAVLACLAARAAITLSHAEGRAREDYLIVRVLGPEGESGLHRAAAALVNAGLRAQVEVITPARAAALLDDGSGRQIDAQALAALRLIEMRLPEDMTANAALAGELRAVLADAGVTADVIIPRQDQTGAVLGRMQRAALWGAAFLALGMALIIGLSARAIASRRGDLIAVLADLGAPRGAALLRLTDEAGATAFFAGLTGVAFAAFAAMMGARFALGTADVAAILARVTAQDIAIAAATPFVAALAAGTGAWLSAGALYGWAARVR